MVCRASLGRLERTTKSRGTRTASRVSCRGLDRTRGNGPPRTPPSAWSRLRGSEWAGAIPSMMSPCPRLRGPASACLEAGREHCRRLSGRRRHATASPAAPKRMRYRGTGLDAVLRRGRESLRERSRLELSSPGPSCGMERLRPAC